MMNDDDFNSWLNTCNAINSCVMRSVGFSRKMPIDMKSA